MSSINHMSQINFIKNENPRIIELVVKLLSSNTLPFYAEFNTYMNYYESDNIPTCAVNITSEGMNFLWNKKFINDLTEKELLFLLIHEDYHLLFDHTKRSIIYDKKVANIVQDMIINQIIYDDIVCDIKLKNKIEIPKHKGEFLLDKDGNILKDKDGNNIKNPNYGNNMGLFIPKEYDGEQIFESLYEWFKIKQTVYNETKKLKNNDNKNNEDNSDGKINGKPQYGNYGKNNVDCISLESIFESLEKDEELTLDVHIDDNIPENARKSIVEDFLQRLKNRGLVSSDVENTLNKLRKSKKDYLKEIKRTITHHIFGSTKRKTITRQNRRSIEGLKGKKKYNNVINCILDTSGSMSGDFEKVLSYIFQHNIHINLIQIDTKIKIVEKIKSKKELEKMKIKGLGGTVLQPAINYINDKSNKLHSYNTVILTDGFTDKLNFNKSKHKTLILTTNKTPIIDDPKELVKIITINLKESIR